jgi:hypothetical protein
MKQFYAWAKFFSLLLTVLAVWVICQIWLFMIGKNMWFDLITPSLGGYPIIDWIITGVLTIFALLAFAFSTVERRSWKNFLFGLPLFCINVFVILIWWRMELGRFEIYLASIILTLIVIGDIFASIRFIGEPLKLSEKT